LIIKKEEKSAELTISYPKKKSSTFLMKQTFTRNYNNR